MTRDVRWIVGALAAALWIAPAAAQTGSTSQAQEKPYTTGSGSDPTRSNVDPNTAPGSHGGAATGAATASPATQQPTATGNGADPTRSNPDSDRAPVSHDTQAGTGSTSSTTGSASTTGNGADPTRSNPDNDRAPVSHGSAADTTSGSTAASAPATAGASAADMAQTAAKLHAGNQAEIQAGQYMEQHAQNSKVKDFAKKMVKDHQSMDKDLMSFAQKKSIDLTSASAATEKEQAKQQLTELQGMSGAQADQHYMTMMVQDHEKDVSDVRSAEQQAKSSDEKDFAKLLGKTAKKMEGHLKDAQKIQRDLTQRQARNPAR